MRSTDLPYRQTFDFNAFGQMTESTNMHWGETEWNSVEFDQTTPFENNYENNLIQKTGWEFDADGRNTKAISDSSEVTLTTFDAAGRVIERMSGGSNSWTYYDGNGAALTSKSTEEQKYQIRSSVLGGQVISQVWSNGKKYRSYVRGIGNQTAVQTAYATPVATLNESVLFEYSDALGMSYRTTDKNAAAVAVGDGGEGSPIETDPLGGSVGTSTPYIEEPVIYEPDPEYPELLPFEIGGGQEMMDFGSMYSFWGSRMADLPGFGTEWGNFFQLDMAQHEERVHNAFLGLGFHTNESLGVPPGVRITGFGLIFGNGSLAGGEWTLEEAISQMEDDEEIFAVWGEADDWLDGWDIFSIQTLEGTPRKGKKGLQQDPANILKEFLKKNPECSKYFDEVAKRINRQNMFGTQISMYGETGPSMVFHDARKFPDRTLASFGVTSNDKNKKLSEIGDPTTAAYTDDDTNQVFLFDRYYAQSRNEQGVILVHESLHEFLSQGNHVELARALGLRFFTLPGDSLEVYAMNQQGASEAITQFIRDGCRK